MHTQKSLVLTKTLGLTLGTLLAYSVFTNAVHAKDIPYSYLNAEYISSDNSDGFTLGGSYDFGNDFYGFAEYALIPSDLFQTDIYSFQLGAAYTRAMDDNIDLIAELSLLSAKQNSPGTLLDTDDSGFIMGLGLRGMLTENTELNGMINYVDLFTGSHTGIELGGLYYSGTSFGVGLSYATIESKDTFSLIGRYTF